MLLILKLVVLWFKNVGWLKYIIALKYICSCRRCLFLVVIWLVLICGGYLRGGKLVIILGMFVSTWGKTLVLKLLLFTNFSELIILISLNWLWDPFNYKYCIIFTQVVVVKTLLSKKCTYKVFESN